MRRSGPCRESDDFTARADVGGPHDLEGRDHHADPQVGLGCLAVSGTEAPMLWWRVRDYYGPRSQGRALPGPPPPGVLQVVEVRGPPGAGTHPSRFFTVNRFCVARLCGRAGRLTALLGVFWPGQI
jgi:hypothetical protein